MRFISMRRHISLRLGSYADRNDGFCRTYFSRSKSKFSRIRKEGKPQRVRLPHKER
jgi:hypothetical protein